MLHELLFGMLGKTGSIIKRSTQGLEVDPSTSLLNASERAVVNELVETGYYYLKLTEFIDLELAETDRDCPDQEDSRLPQVDSYKGQGDIRLAQGDDKQGDYRQIPSVYRKAMAHGLRTALKTYEQLVLSIQNAYLSSRHFTYAGIRAETSRYQVLLRDSWDMVCQVRNEGHRGGAIIDLVNARIQGGSEWSREWLGSTLQECHKVFKNQVTAWAKHGQIVDPTKEFFVHRVLTGEDSRFKFTKGNSIEVTDWEMFTLSEVMVPKSLIDLETAGKILFIGKSIKILGRTEKTLGTSRLLLGLEEVGSAGLQAVVEEERKRVAKEMIDLIVGEQNLQRELRKVNDYYLLFKGDFYHRFLEESLTLRKIHNKDKMQHALAEIVGRISPLEDVKRLSFEVKQLGFAYLGFKNFINICPVGNVDLIEGLCVRLSSAGGAIWHRSKQAVENDFTILYSLRFKAGQTTTNYSSKTRQIATNSTRQRAGNSALQCTESDNIVCFVIQNACDVSPSSYQNPGNLARIPEYLSINVGNEYDSVQNSYVSVVQIKYRNERKNPKEICLQELRPKGLNFLQGNTHTVKVSYRSSANDELLVSISSQDVQPYSLKAGSLRLSNYLSLEMGRATVGFVSKIGQHTCVAQLNQWQMVCKPVSHYGDLWSDLSLCFKVPWPVSLLLTADVMEIFGRIHKFLLTIRKTQIDLESMWLRISRKMKEERESRADTDDSFLSQFERQLASTRAKMSLFINNLWGYLLVDIAQTASAKLREGIDSADDFEDVIAMIAKYVRSLQLMYFFNVSKIQRMIHQLVKQCRAFVTFFDSIEIEVIKEQTQQDLLIADQQFSSRVKDFFQLLRELAKTTSSNHLFHLTLRMEACLASDYYF